MNPKFHRYAMLIAIGALVLIAIGAYITSQATGAQPATRGILDGVVHKYVAFGVGALALGFAYWQSLDREVPLLVWTALGVFALVGWVGWLGGALLHASLAPVAFTIFVAVAAITSPGWHEAPELVADPAAAALRIFAAATPPLVLLQIMLGAGYRHKLIGLLPHLGGALVVTLAILVLGMLVRQRHPAHKKLCAAATWLMCFVGLQVALGFTALLLPILRASPIAVIAATAAHVVVGSMTLAANVVLVMLVHRSVWLAPAVQSKERD
ncbi:MAG TPA: hypothetical protein VFW44_20025 [Bryobacteraceae bacterium]|nr:hypothetical protein [Bryobacteraceae bacterium]